MKAPKLQQAVLLENRLAKRMPLKSDSIFHNN